MVTKGKWYVRGEYILADHMGICALNLNIKEWEANANLIASAPDLYEACKQVDSDCITYWDKTKLTISQNTWQAILVALAKADGKE